MKNEKKVLERLLDARVFIASTPIKKEGKNSFSKYSYFTPSQITSLVTAASVHSGIISTFKMSAVDGEPVGFLKVTNIHDESNSIEFQIPTSIPDIKATSSTQKLGGMVTYTQRYLEMLAFSISDNNLDLDSQDNRGAKEEPTRKPSPTDAQLKAACNALETGNNKKSKEDILIGYSWTTEQKNAINAVIIPSK